MSENIKKLVLFGAGNIGRSFIAQVFSRDNYEIVFIDINQDVINKINNTGSYDVINLNPDGSKEAYTVKNVRAVNGQDKAKVIQELNTASLVSTSVGKQALAYIVGNIAEAAQQRQQQNKPPLDVILAENIREGRQYMLNLAKEHLQKQGNNDIDLTYTASILGFVETSIGKMVPLQDSSDNLDVFCEPYNTLILSSDGFHQSPPQIPAIKAVKNINAWVDRKLFIHNLGHASCAYFGRAKDKNTEYLWQSLQNPYIEWKVRTVMLEAGKILLAEYPTEFTQKDIINHVDDLLNRFKNQFLGDTIYRVGRDLSRKLHKSDRVLGAILLGKKHNLPVSNIFDTYLTACDFGKLGNDKNDYKPSEILHNKGIVAVLKEIGGLDNCNQTEIDLIDEFTN